MFYKNNQYFQNRTFFILPLFILLILIGTFTIIPSFEQNNNLDWNQICNTVEFALYNSCDVYVNTSGQLTYEGERAMGCIRNGLLIGGAATGLSVPLEIIVPGLDILAGMTGCDGIVKLDLLSTIGNPSQLLDMFSKMPSQNIVTETLPQIDVGENTRPENDFSENTIPQKGEFLLFNNKLFSVYYPSEWEYEELRVLDEPSVIFRATNYPGGDVIAFTTHKSEGTTLYDSISNLTQLKKNPSNMEDIQPTDIITKNIYVGNYPALKFTANLKVNSELNYFQKQTLTEYVTIANGKLYQLTLWSNPSQSTETNPIFERMVSSFEILPLGTTNDSSNTLQQNEETKEDLSLYENSTLGIKINYPKNWTIESSQEKYPLTNVAIFYSPEDKDYVEVQIYTYDYSNTEIESLRELLNDAIDSFTLYPNDFPEFKLLRTSITSTDKLADMPAYVLEGEYKDPEFGKQMVLEQGMIKDNINYYILYFASPSQYQSYLDDVETMIQSFKIQK